MDIKRIVLVGATLVMAALLAGCAVPGQNDRLASGSLLRDSEWVLTSLAGQALIKDTQITLSFGEGLLEGSAGCNTYGGSYTATEDSLRLSDLYWTEMGCLEPEGILDQEIAYLNALDTVASYRVDAGRLELYDEAGTQILVFGPQESALMATIEAPESLPTGEVVNVRFTLISISSVGFFILKWFTPLEGLAGDIFSVQRDGAEVPYRGKMVKQGPPVSEDYVWLDAGGSIAAEVDLAEGYDFSQTGQYTLQFRSPRLSHIAQTSGEQADSLDELEKMRVPSSPISVAVQRSSQRQYTLPLAPGIEITPPITLSGDDTDPILGVC
jgi:heat shock protein HslJ